MKFTADYAFVERRRGIAYTFSEVTQNREPIALSDNHFYGNTLDRAAFIYEGSAVRFDNNVVIEGRLIIPAGVKETPLASVIRQFKFIERPSR